MARLSETTRRAAETGLALLGQVPTTNLRIVVTMGLYVATGVVTMATDNLPGGWDWAIVLLLMAGLDAAQFMGKRTTHREPASGAPQP